MALTGSCSYPIFKLRKLRFRGAWDLAQCRPGRMLASGRQPLDCPLLPSPGCPVVLPVKQRPAEKLQQPLDQRLRGLRRLLRETQHPSQGTLR